MDSEDDDIGLELTQAVADRILNLVVAGADFPLACLNAGVDPNQGQEWVDRGLQADGSDPDDAPYIAFAKGLELGQVKAEARAVAIVFNAQEKNPRLAQEWLKQHGGRHKAQRARARL